VVTGRVEQGVVKVGEEVEVVGLRTVTDATLLLTSSLIV
jgi:translation elongation factor EF-Tu-like GTPase